MLPDHQVFEQTWKAVFSTYPGLAKFFVERGEQFLVQSSMSASSLPLEVAEAVISMSATASSVKWVHCSPALAGPW